MKPFRLILIGLSAIALLLVLGVVLALTPGVQTWAAKKFAPATAELSVGIGHVNAGLNQTRVDNVRVVQPGLVLTIPSAEVDISVIDAAGGKVEVRRLVAKGWVLDLTAPGAAPATPAKTPEAAVKTAFNGIFKLIQLPVDLAVDGVDLAGEVILPEGRAQVTITGGGLANGGDGKFVVTADMKSADSTVAFKGVLGAHMNSTRTFDRFSLTADASAKTPQVPQGATASIVLNAATDGQNETYAFSLSANGREVVQARVALPPGTAPLAGTWTLDATQADVVPFALGRPLPDFVAKGKGTFETDRFFGQIKATGSFDATLDKLGALQSELATLGRLKFTAGFDVTTQGDVVRLNTLDVSLAGERPVFTVTAQQAIEFNLKTSAATAVNPSADLVRLTLDGLPLAWAKPFLGDIALTGGDVRGAFTVTANDGGFAVRAAAPITLTNLSVSQAGKPLVNALDVSLSSRADYTPKGWAAEITNLSAHSGLVQVFKLTAKAAQASGEKQPLEASGTYEVNLVAALAQPAAAGLTSLQEGIARGDFGTSIADVKHASVTLQLANLVMANGSTLPTVAFQARADVDATGVINATAPIIISHGGRLSDITLGARVTRDKTATQVMARLTGEVINIGDLMLFSALAPAKPTSAVPAVDTKPSPKSPAPVPATPLWAGLNGELNIAFTTVVYSKDVVVKDIGGVVKITPDTLTLERLVAALKTGGNLKATGGLRFDAKQPQPYGLKADVSLLDVEPAPILRALSPGKPSPVEGKFNLTTQVSGRAVDPAGFTDSVIGDIKLTGQNGTFRALSVKSSAAVENAGKAAAVAGLLGALAGSDSTVKYADRARAAADVTKQLGAIKFEQLSLVLARDAENNLGIKDLSILSPVVRLVGSGIIAYQPGVPLMQQPLLLNLQLGAKDKLADDLRSLKLIGDKTDAAGYSFLAEDLKLDGSLQAVGTKQISGLIERALTN
jgi:hypothetical protein